MAARREHGAPSALTVLEVAEGLRWSDPALGASLAEHVRRLAGDDSTVRAAADRSVIRSLAESDRHDDVVERGVPLLTEARARGDREDGAAVLVELAAAATALGDPRLARRLLDRLGPVHDLPARIGATACAARAEACAADGDVAATDAAGDAAGTMLLRVAQPESAVVRARIELARGVARRRAGDLDGALAVLIPVVSADPAADVDGGRRSFAAAAEVAELLVEAGRPEEAKNRVRAILPDGTPGPHVAAAVGRIRLALAAGIDDGGAAATTSAEELEAAGRDADAARAWELVAARAEASGDLGRALAALRRGHALVSSSRGTGDRALRELSAVAEVADLLAAPTGVEGLDGPDGAGTPDGTGTPDGADGSDGVAGAPVGRRGRRNGSPVHRTPLLPPGASAAESGAREPEEASTSGSDVVPPPSLTTWPDPGEPIEHAPVGGSREWTAAADPSDRVAEVPAPATTGPISPPAGTAPRPADELAAAGGAPRSSTRDELAELLASLTRSVDSSRAAASAMGLEPAPPASVSEDPPRSGDRHAEDLPAPFVFGSEPAAHTDPWSNSEPVAEPLPSRPTFDAFSTAPLRDDAGDAEGAATPVAPLPDDRFAPADDGRSIDRSPGSPRRSAVDASPAGGPDDLLGGVSAWRASDDRASEAARVTETSRTPDPEDDGPRLEPGLGSTRPAPSPRPLSAASDGSTSPGTEDRRAESGDRRPTEPAAGVGPTGRDEPATGRATTRPTADGRTAPAEVRSSSPRSASNGGAADELSGADVRRASADDSTRRSTGADDDVRRGARGETGPRSGRDAVARAERTRPDQRGRTPAPTPGQATDRPAGEYEEELALTLATVLGEYHLPDVPMPPRRDGRRATPPDPAGGGAAGEVSVPSARRHTSGSMPVPGETHRAPRAGSPSDPVSDAAGAQGRDGSSAGRGRPPESGARLADLLAEAMDAFRHVGPDAQDGARGPGVGSRRA